MGQFFYRPPRRRTRHRFTPRTKIASGGPTSPPAFRSITTLNYGSRSSPTNLTKPTGTADGDILIALINAGGNTSGVDNDITPPAGWTAVTTATEVTASGISVKNHVFWKRASSEGASYDFAHNAGATRATGGAIAAYSGGVTSGNPIDVFSTNSGITDPSIATALSVTTTVDNTMLVIAGHNFDALTVTAATGFTQRFAQISVLQDGAQTTAGASGNKTYDSGSLNADPWQAWLLAIKPAASTGLSAVASAGSYSFTGLPATMRTTKVLIAEAGSYSFTGADVTLTHPFNLTAAPGAYAFTGSTVALIKVTPAAAPVFVAEAHISYGPNDGFTIDKPTGTVDNDIMIASIFTAIGGGPPTPIAPPAGWTAIAAATSVNAGGLFGQFRVWWKRAESEGSSYAFTHGVSTQNSQGIIVSYSGSTLTGSPIDTYTTNSGTGTTATGLEVTTAGNYELLISTGHNWQADGAEPFSGATERLDSVVTLSDGEQTLAGASGDKTYDAGNIDGSDPWSSWLIALRSGAAVLYEMFAEAGAYAFTGVDQTPRAGRKLIALAGAYAFTGQTVTIKQTHLLAAAAGAYSFTGQEVTLSYSNAVADLLVAGAGAYNMEGTTVDVGRGLIALGGAYAFTGVAAGLKRARKLVAAAGAYAFTGLDVVAVKSVSGTVAIVVHVQGEGLTLGSNSVAAIAPKPYAWWPYPAEPISSPPPLAPVFRSVSFRNYASHVSPTVFNAPFEIIDGDILIAVINAGGNSSGADNTITPPAGWTEVAPATEVTAFGISVMHHVFWKRASDEGISYSFSHNNDVTRNTGGAISVYSGCILNGDPVDVVSFSAGIGETATALSVTTTVDNTMLVIAGHNFDAFETIPADDPPGFTSRYGHITVVKDGVQVVAGASGNVGYVSGSVSNTPWQTWLLALKPLATISTGGTSAGTLSFHDQMLTADEPPASASAITTATMPESGKHYAETTILGANPFGHWGLYNAEENTGILIELETGDIITKPADERFDAFNPIRAGDTLGVAYDGDTGEVWLRVNGGPWNGDYAQAPDSTGVGLWERPTDVGSDPPEMLTPYDGPYIVLPPEYEVNVALPLYENLYFAFTFKCLADNVTFRNCYFYNDFDYLGLDLDLTDGCIVDHCTIASNGQSTALVTGNNLYVGYCEIFGYENGIGVGSNGIVENNYIHDLYHEISDPHIDGIQLIGGNVNVDINNNWVEAWDTSCLIAGATYGAMDNILIENNTFINDPTKTLYAGPMVIFASPLYPITNLSIFRNRLQRGTGGSYVVDENIFPETRHNIDYDTSQRIMLYWEGFGVTSPAMTIELGDEHVPPVEPVGSSATAFTNYIGLGGDIEVATPVRRSYTVSEYGMINDAYVDRPAGVQENDLLIVALFMANSVANNPDFLDPVPFSPGWTQMGEYQEYVDTPGTFQGKMSIWWKRAGPAEPAQYLWGFFNANLTQSYCVAYQNVTLAGAVDTFSQQGGFGDLAVAAEVSTTQKTDVLIYIGATFDGAGNLSPPTGMTEIVDSVLYVAEQTLTDVGPTGTREQTQNPSGFAYEQPWMNFLIALRGI